MKLTFIILQYNTPKETVGCVESILQKMQYESDYNIVIVDNGSKFENYEKTFERYVTYPMIDITRIKDNKGFSNGNNYGYKYAKQRYNPEFYFFMSNDTRLLTEDTIEVIDSEYKNYGFDILGCDITNLDGKHTSPCGFINETPKSYLSSWYNRLSSRLKEKKENKVYTGRETNRLLQGSALIFSKKAFEKLILPFYPETFLYHEENILSFNICKNWMISLYTPRINVLHRESKSVDKDIKNKFRRFIYKQIVQDRSLRLFLKYKRENK
jgi:GT2 family glycosyltransferase